MNDMTATLRGLTIGSGTIYPWRGSGVSGLLDTPTIRSTDSPAPNRNGIIPGADYYGGRLVSFEMLIAEGKVANEVAAAALGAAFAASDEDVWLDVRVTGSPAEYSLRGRPRGTQVAIRRDRWDAGVIDVRASFLATDPLRYGPEESAGIVMTAPGGGLTFPATFPVVFGGGGGSGSAAILNVGAAPVHWTAVLTGPLTNPLLSLDGSGRSIRVLATIATGETVTLDSASSAILLGGTTPRPQWFGPGSRWFLLPAGASSVTFTADSGDGSALLTWRPGWP